MTLLEVIRETVARIARARDYAVDGEIEAALTVLEDLELDVERALAEIAISLGKSGPA